ANPTPAHISSPTPTPRTGGTNIRKKPSPPPTTSSNFSTENRINANTSQDTPALDPKENTGFGGLIADRKPVNPPSQTSLVQTVSPPVFPSASPRIELTQITGSWSRILVYSGFASIVLTFIVWMGIFGLRSLKK
ncbi:MAG: hypothetical protein AAB874_07440, partial [Patescibacteria group bacterium]